MRVRRCCVANCGCRRLRGDYGKELYKFPKWLWDSYAAASGQGGGKLSFEPLPPKPEWQYVCLCASAYAKVLHKLYGKSVVDAEDATAKNVFVNVCKALDKCGYRDGDPDGPTTRAICKDALAAHDAYVAAAPPETERRKRRRTEDSEPAPTPSTPGDGPPTEGPWTDDTVREHPLVALLLRVLRSGAPEGVYTGAWLRSDTLTFAQMHTAYREILIGHGAGVGLGKLWMDAYADKMLRWAMSYENRFIRGVVDAWYGVGESGLGRGRGGAHQYDVARRRAIAGLPPWSAIQIRRPPQSHAGLLVKVTDMSLDAAARHTVEVDPADVLVSPYAQRVGSKVPFVLKEVVLAKWPVGTATAYYPAEVVGFPESKPKHVELCFDGDTKGTTRVVPQAHIVRELEDPDSQLADDTEELLDALETARAEIDGEESDAEAEQVSETARRRPRASPRRPAVKLKHSVAASPARETGTQKKIAVPESAQALGPMDRPRRRGVAAVTRPTGGAPAREGAAATSTAPTVPRRRVTRGEGRRLAAEDRSNPRPRWKV